MNNLYLVLWLCLFPVASSLSTFIIIKRRSITGQPQPTIKELEFQNIIDIFIWIVITIKLW